MSLSCVISFSCVLYKHLHVYTFLCTYIFTELNTRINSRFKFDVDRENLFVECYNQSIKTVCESQSPLFKENADI